ncbi:MAG: peptide deformylase [Anaerovoracaceae bacterium]
MALRNIVKVGDPILRKKSREVGEITERIRILIDDMIETMNDAEGVGLAAPQVGVLKRIFVVDVGEGPIVLINPEIIEKSGEQTGSEGCLSVPDRSGEVTRPNYVKIRGLDREGNEVEYEGTELLARAFCHENDHLDGIIYTDYVKELHVLGGE